MPTAEELRRLIAAGETLTVEFKGEERSKLSDREIYEAVVCLANCEGGVLLVGVEDDRRVTGARPRHGTCTNTQNLHAAVLNNTVPGIETVVSIHMLGGAPVIAIEVLKIPAVCATKDGRCVRRTMGLRGPECLPYYPFEHVATPIDLGLEVPGRARSTNSSVPEHEP